MSFEDRAVFFSWLAVAVYTHRYLHLLNSYAMQVPGLHVPLMTLIDYRGCRLIALSILPLDGLVYGRCVKNMQSCLLLSRNSDIFVPFK